MKPYAFGVDIGGTTIKMGLFRTNGELLEVWEIPTRTPEGKERILLDIKEGIDGKLAEKGIDAKDLEGIGLGVPGPVSPDGTVLKCVNLKWDVFNIEEELSALTGQKVKAGNDANVAALGEMWMGGGKGYSDVVMVTLGTGVGGGVIIGGKILAGINGAAGEIGHIPMNDEETDVCGCGKRGCLEQYASATGVVRLTKKYLAENPDTETSLRAVENVSAKDLFDAAKAGDSAALAVVDQFGRMLGKGLAQVACVTNPEAFVIGGGMSRAGEILMDAANKYYKEYAFHAAKETAFKPALLGNNAGIYGGVKMVLG